MQHLQCPLVHRSWR